MLEQRRRLVSTLSKLKAQASTPKRLSDHKHIFKLQMDDSSVTKVKIRRGSYWHICRNSMTAVEVRVHEAKFKRRADIRA